MISKVPPRNVVRRWPSEQTCGGDFVQDDTGQVWRIVDRQEADVIRSGTGGAVGRLLPNGKIQP